MLSLIILLVNVSENDTISGSNSHLGDDVLNAEKFPY